MSENIIQKFKDKVALVTGGTSGIGRATTLAFAAAGANVVVAKRRENEGSAVVAEIEKTGGAAIFVKTDVADEAVVENLIAKTVERFGKLDYAFNNAGTEGSSSPIHEASAETFDRIFDVNVKGTFFSLKHAIRQMLKQGTASAVVNTSSISGLIGFANMAVYSASKHAILGLTKSVALEVAKQNIRVNAVSPAGIGTEMLDRLVGGNEQAAAGFTAAHPIGRIGRPEEIANAVLWLCSDEALFVVGQSLTIDGGYTAQ